jgi:phosphatidylglycerol---prolipoprotein diacylglyceryl transferase
MSDTFFSIFPSRAVAFDIFGWSIYWYGLLYFAAFLLAFWILPRLQKHRNLLLLDRNDWADLLTWAVIGVILGGRLGFVLFYEPQYFLISPLKIFEVWEGGMSSHGGFIGVATSLFFFLRKRGWDVWSIADLLTVPIAIGLAFGRTGNFINQELYGPVTTLPWAISIPSVEGLRHPTQIYAVIKNLVIAACCLWHLKFMRPIRAGTTFALFLVLYAILRFLIEYLRTQEYGLIDLGVISLSRGQLLTVPILLAGVLLLRLRRR